ncbi:MAG TPA: hypothetical protein VGH28_17820, partial [Polyangiaceae bacterium]
MSAAWDARFFIAIFPDGEWCKVHTFSGGKTAGKHCLSALEGLDGGAQEIALVGRGERVERRTGDVTCDGGSVRALGVEASVDARDRFYWIRLPRVLAYHSATGPARVTIDGQTREAFGVLEHAWGAETRIDVARLAPRRWRWDVLSCGGDRFFAGLAVHGFGPRGGARIGTGGLTNVSAVRIRSGRERWSGAMRTREGTLRYEARAATPVAPEVEGGGFLG